MDQVGLQEDMELLSARMDLPAPSSMPEQSCFVFSFLSIIITADFTPYIFKTFVTQACLQK